MNLDKFTQDGQDPKVIEKLTGKLANMLMQGEVISYIALQKKPAVTLLPDSIAISNKRIFLCEFTKLGLATNFEIFLWKDIKDIAFKEEIFGSKVTVIPFTGENLTIDYIPKVQARKLFQLIKEALDNVDNDDVASFVKPTATAPKIEAPIVQKETYERPAIIAEPIVEDKSFSTQQYIQDIEEEEEDYNEVEIATPIITRTPTSIENVQAVSNISDEEDDEITLKLKKLKSLYEKQLITQAEYENKKAEVLSQL